MSKISHPRKARQAYLFAIVAALALAVVLGLYGHLDRQAELRAAAADARLIADQTARASEGALDAMREVMATLRILAELKEAPQSVDRHLRTRVSENKYLMDLLILAPDGRITAWSGSGTPPDVRDRDYFRKHLGRTSTPLYFGVPLLSKVHSGKWFFALSEAVRDDEGKIRHIVVAIVDIELLKTHLSVPLPAPDSTQTLFGMGGEVYARQPDHAAMVGKRIDLGAITGDLSLLAAEKPAHLVSPLDGKARIVAAARVGKYPLVAVGSRTIQSALAQWHRRLVIVILFWTAMTVVLLLMARTQTRHLRLQEHLARTDALTGSPNRRAILEAADDIQQHSERPLALAMVDADHFKRINDQYGHVTGDAVLREIARTLRRHCRTTDLVGRYGGEEFLVLMPDTDLAGARIVAEKLRQAVAAMPPDPQPISVSIGVALAASGVSLSAAMKAADQALYQAKEMGRNRVCLAPPPATTADLPPSLPANPPEEPR